MAYSIADIYQDAILERLPKEYLNYSAILKINGNDVDSNNIKSITIDDSVIDSTSNTMYIGTFISKKIEVEFKNSDEIDLNGKVDLSISMELKLSNPSPYTTTVPIGKFNIETSPEDYYNNAKLVALDNAVLFKPNVDISQFFTDIGDSRGITLENLLIALCNYYDVELGTYPTINKDLVVYSYDSTVSGKQYVSWIAELMGGNAKFDRNGVLNIIPAKQEIYCYLGNVDRTKSFTLGEMYKVSRVVYENGVVKSDFGENTYNTLYIRPDNMFINGTSAQINTIIQNIYNSIEGLEIWSLKNEYYGLIQLDSTDIIVFNYNGNEYPTYYSGTITYEMSVMGKINVEIPTKQVQETTKVVPSGADAKIRNLEIKVDRENNLIKQEITEKTGKLDEQVSTVEQSVEGLTVSVNSIIGSIEKKFEDTNTDFIKIEGVGKNSIKSIKNIMPSNRYGERSYIRIMVSSNIAFTKIVYERVFTISTPVVMLTGYSLNYEDNNLYILSPTQDRINVATDVEIPNPEGTSYLSVEWSSNNSTFMSYVSDFYVVCSLSADFVTKSELRQTASEINATVSQKVGKDEVINSINLSTEGATINANKISLRGKTIEMTTDNINLNSNYLAIDNKGNITITDYSSLAWEWSCLTVKSSDNTKRTLVRSGGINIINMSNDALLSGSALLTGTGLSFGTYDDDHYYGFSYSHGAHHITYNWNNYDNSWSTRFIYRTRVVDGVPRTYWESPNDNNYIDIVPRDTDPYICVREGSNYAMYRSSGQYVSSDKKIKTNILDIQEELSMKIINDLKPVQYKYKQQEETHRGLIAQDVKETLEKYGVNNQIYNYDEKNELYALNYIELIPDLINCIKVLNKKIEELEKRN